jgi:hypothetical protein
MLDIIAKGTLFASVGADGKFTISKVRKVSDTEVVRDYKADARSYRTTTCGTGAHGKETMLALAKTIDAQGVGVPSAISTVADICVYTELLAREARKGVCAWLTPEEYSVVYGDPAVSKRMTAAFKVTKTD